MSAVLVPAAWILGVVAVPCGWGYVLALAADRASGEAARACASTIESQGVDE